MTKTRADYDYRLVRLKLPDGAETTISMTPEFKLACLRTYKTGALLRARVHLAATAYDRYVASGRWAGRSAYIREWLLNDMRTFAPGRPANMDYRPLAFESGTRPLRAKRGFRVRLSHQQHIIVTVAGPYYERVCDVYGSRQALRARLDLAGAAYMQALERGPVRNRSAFIRSWLDQDMRTYQAPEVGAGDRVQNRAAE